MKLFLTEESTEDKKCPVCSSPSNNFYWVGDSLGKSLTSFKDSSFKQKDAKTYGHGICSRCMTEHLKRNEFKISKTF